MKPTHDQMRACRYIVQEHLTVDDWRDFSNPIDDFGQAISYLIDCRKTHNQEQFRIILIMIHQDTELQC